MIKPKETKRKFYNKWIYKVTVKSPGVSMFRMKTFEEIIDFCYSSEPERTDTYWSRIYRSYWHHRVSLLNLTKFLMPVDNSIYTKRIEKDCIDLYTNDSAFYNSICDNFSDLIVQKFEPVVDNLNLLDNEKTVICKKLPHDKYKYKVFLRPHKMKNDVPNKQHYLKWLDTQSDRVLITEAVKRWFIETDWNWDRRYMYVEDKPTLLMLSLRNSEVLGQVYEYVKADK